MRRHRRPDSLILLLSLIIISGGFPLICTGAGEKPEIEVPEVVINASAPLLTAGVKDQIPVLETSGSAGLIADSVIRAPLGFPDMLEVTQEPQLQEKSSCLIPWLGGALAPVQGVKGRMYKASKAWSRGEWQTVVDELIPVIKEDPPVPECPKALYFAARSKEKLGDVPGAMGLFDRLRREYPDHPLAEHASYALGWMYLKYHNLPHAEEIIEEYLRRYPAGTLAPYVRYLKAAVHYQAGEYKKALEALEGIVAGYPLFPYMAQVQFWLAENQFFNGLESQAEANYSLYINNYPDGEHVPDALYGRAFCRLRLGDVEGAMADFKQVTTRFPAYPRRISAAFQAGKIAASGGDTDNALNFFRIAAKNSDPQAPDALEARAWIRFESRDFDAAATLFRKVAEISPHPNQRREARFMEALAYYKSGNYTKSADTFTVLAQSIRGRLAYAAWANAGIARMKNGDYTAAKDLFDQALKAPADLADRPVYVLYAAETLYRLGRYDESLKLYRSLDETNLPPELAAERIRGIAWNLYTLQQWKDAADAFKQLADRFPDSPYHPEALLRQAECHFNADHFEEAARRFQALIDEYPLHPEALEARIMLAKIQWVQGDKEKAHVLLEDALKYAGRGVDRQRVHILMGELAQDRDRFDEAVSFYERAYFDAPASSRAPEALLKQADNLYNQKKYDEAERVYRRIIQDFPESETAAVAQYAVGLTYFQRHRLEDYLAECRKTVEMHPGSRQSALALMGAAEILADQDRPEEAAADYRVLLESYRAHINEELVRFKLAQVLEASGRHDEAREAYETLLQRYPHGLFTADAAFALARMAEADGDAETALADYRIVIDRFPAHPMYPEALLKAARILMDGPDPDAAEPMLKQVIQRFPASRYAFEANLLMGILEYRRNRCDEADVYLKAAERSSERRQVAAAKMIRCRCLDRSGAAEDAISCFLRIGYLYPEQKSVVLEALLAAGERLAGLGRVQEARRVLKRALSAATSEADREKVRKLLGQLGKDTGGRE